MKITIGNLRRLIREWAGAPASKPRFNNDPQSPTTRWSDREQLGSLAGPGNVEDIEELPPHLREPGEEADDCWGPVPPTEDNPYYATQDPLTRDTSPIPTPGIRNK